MNNSSPSLDIDTWYKSFFIIGCVFMILAFLFKIRICDNFTFFFLGLMNCIFSMSMWMAYDEMPYETDSKKYLLKVFSVLGLIGISGLFILVCIFAIIKSPQGKKNTGNPAVIQQNLVK